MFYFYSQQLRTITRGKAGAQQQFQQSALLGFFFKADPAEQGWFRVSVKTTRERALQLMSTVGAVVSDLIVEDDQGQRLLFPGAAAA